MELRSVREFERWRTRRYKQYINCKRYFKKYICTDFICSFAHGFHVAKPVFLYLSLTCLTSRKVNSCTSKLDSSTSSQESTVRTPPNRVKSRYYSHKLCKSRSSNRILPPLLMKTSTAGPFPVIVEPGVGWSLSVLEDLRWFWMEDPPYMWNFLH